ncbi:hypothetical protein J4422_01525 [Candidatus Pacearchaeota archaeon]|nr:hypothetical protein [Candidatus Pacearchaeota archaeon]
MAQIDEILTQVGEIGLWLQALGIVILLMILFNVISFISNKKKLKELTAINKNIKRIEKKVNKILEQID